MPQRAALKNHPFSTFSSLNVLACFSSRLDANMSLHYGDTRNSLDNRRNFLEGLGVDYRNLVCAKQIHSSNVAYVDRKDKGRGASSYDTAIEDTDALITNERNLPLAIFTADCLSVFLYDPKNPAIGLVHAGYKSSRENIVAKTVKAMEDRLNSRSGDLCAGFGPAIRVCCYAVEEELRESFPQHLTERGGEFYLDLAQVNKSELLDAGVKEGNIFDSGICTFCQNERFFSFRKEGSAAGRMISVMMLKYKESTIQK